MKYAHLILLGSTLLSSGIIAQNVSPVFNRVFDYVPAPGQFINELPLWEEGYDASAMAEKAKADILNPDAGLISLGAYGGYITVGFEKTIVNVAGERDFYIRGNAVQSDQYNEPGGSSEPGVVMVAYDINKNGLPDDNEWFEIAGSEYLNSFFDYEITYSRPTSDADDIPWTDNYWNKGFVYRNEGYHTQPYWPQWVKEKELKFKGIRLPDNGVVKNPNPYYFLKRFDYGYADNYPNVDDKTQERSAGAMIDIGWAVDANGNEVEMPGVDFVRIYTGVNQANSILGECSTEVGEISNVHTVRDNSGKEFVDESIVMDPQVLSDFLAKYNPQGGVSTPTNKGIRVYINPEGQLQFHLNASGVVAVYDMQGHLLLHCAMAAGKQTLDLSEFPAGVYVLNIDGQIVKIGKR